jgi:heme exporter protein C
MTNRSFLPVLIVSAAMFVAAPVFIAWAPYEATMGLVQKVFYYHVPSAMVMLLSLVACGVASALFLFKGHARADRYALATAELGALFGAIVLVTGPLWARKAWGVWWQWDVRLTSSLVLWMISLAYLLLRRYGGPGSEKLAAGVALFGMMNVPFVYLSVNFWRTLHPTTSVVTTLAPGMRGPFWWSVAAFVLLYVVLLEARVRLEDQRARLEELHLRLDEQGI